MTHPDLINLVGDERANEFMISIDEARAIHKLLLVYGGHMKEMPDEYNQILRLVNGLGQFVDQYDSLERK